MAKASPRAWFTSPIARISYRKVDKYDQAYAHLRPFFPTWGEAHAWMLTKAAKDLKTAEQNLASAKRHMAKVKAMTEPAVQKAGSSEAGFASPLVLICVAALALIFIAVTWQPATPEVPPAPVPGATVAYRPFVFIDDVAGCQYLSTHNSTGLAPRIAPDGKSHMGCKGTQQ